MKPLHTYILAITFFFTATALANSDKTSEGSAAISQGSIQISEGAAKLFSGAAKSSVGFAVESIETSGDIAVVTLISMADSAKASTEVTISMTSATLESLALTAGTLIEVMQVYNEQKEKVLGYLLMDKGDVLLFVAEEAGFLTLKSKKL